MSEGRDYFGRVIQTGWHERSIRMVHAGKVDASAIDSHVLALTLHDHPELADGLRVIDTLGPSTIQPVVVASWLSEELKADLRSVLLEMSNDPQARAVLLSRQVECFTTVTDEDYDDLRDMRAACVAAGLTKLTHRCVGTNGQPVI
jgi:phosphonate transport system substrate-binding protein